MKHLGSGLRVLVVADHHAGAPDGKLAHLAGRDIRAVIIEDAGLPAVARHADGADLADVLHAEMDAAGAEGFAQAVVGIVLVMREMLLPAGDQARRDRLRTDVHQPPLVKHIVLFFKPAALQVDQDVLRPGNQQPHDGAFFLADGTEDPFGLYTAQQHRLAAGDQAAEPVHLGPGVVQRRDAEENVVPGLAVVLLLGKAGVHQRAVPVQDGLGEACRSGGKIDGGAVVLLQQDRRRFKGAVGHEAVKMLGVGGQLRLAADKEAAAELVHGLRDLLEPIDEFTPEHQDLHVGKLQAVGDLIGGIAEVERDGDAARFQDPKIDGQPLQAVHHQDADFGPLPDAAAEQKIGHAVGFFVKTPPGQVPAVGGVGTGFNEARLPPAFGLVALVGGVDLHQRNLSAVQSCVSLQKVRDYHVASPLFFL